MVTRIPSNLTDSRTGYFSFEVSSHATASKGLNFFSVTDHLLPVSIILQKVSKRRFTFSFNFPNRLTFQKFLDFLVLFKRMLIQSFDKRVVVFIIQDVHFRYFQILQIFNILSG